MSGSSAAATSATTRSKRSSIKKTKTTKIERRSANSPQPEQPTIKPTSYTTSWDLTIFSATSLQAPVIARAPLSPDGPRDDQAACGLPKLCSQRRIIPICGRNRVLRPHTDDAEKL